MLKVFRRLAIAGLLLVVILDVAFGVAVRETRKPPLPPMTPERAYEVARPATTLIQAEFDVGLSIPDVVVPPGPGQRLHDQLQQMIYDRTLAYDTAAINRQAMKIILSDPATYLGPADTRAKEDEQLYSSGTGFFVTESGFLVTAAHVVAPTKSDLLTEILNFDTHPEAIKQLRQDLSDWVRGQVGISPSDAEIDTLSAWYQGYVNSHLSVDSVASKFYIGTGTVHAGTDLVSHGVRASLIASDEPFPKRDLAVLKADMTAAPALTLAPAEPTVKQVATIVGYPRGAHLDEPAQFDATVPAVYSSGRVWDVRADNGFKAFGTDAIVHPGNSGGPVLDAQGRVVGVLSYGQGSAEGGRGYFISVDSIRAELAAAGVHAKAGALTSDYRDALRDGDLKRYKDELVALEHIRRTSAWDAYVADDITRTQSELLAGHDRTPPPIEQFAVPVLLGSLGVALAILLFSMVVFALDLSRVERRVAPGVAIHRPPDYGGSMGPSQSLAESADARPSQRTSLPSTRLLIGGVAAAILAATVGLWALTGGPAASTQIGSSGSAADANSAPVLTVHVNQDKVTVWGVSFPGSTQVTLYLDSVDGPQLGSVLTQANGNLDVTTVSLPATARSGRHQIRACWTVGSSYKCPVGAPFDA